MRTTDRKKLIGGLWPMIELQLKTLKKLTDNELCLDMKKTLWDSTRKFIDAIQSLERFECKQFYKWSDYGEKDYIIFRLEEFDFDDSREKSLKLICQILTCTKTEYGYRKLEDSMEYDPTSFYNYCKPIEIKNEDLPTYINNPFNGTLFEEMMKTKKKPELVKHPENDPFHLDEPVKESA